MLLTRASEYALLSLALIGEGGEPKDVETLSKQLDISKSFLAKVLQNLAKNGILISYKGAKGGFALNKRFDEISIIEVIKAAEGKNPSVFDCSPSQECCPGDRANSCVIWPFLNRLQNKIDGFLENLTLKDILDN
ncbi:Rrf2 family transcriptional regulator [Hydrogenimonas thermophila]|uniref:Transcriptional regulator, BadM/Rrf2 family n=1 Tax=Hydrogenimonas thermophila TaxID=223786 RepID=A0A1I5MN99_9BACT|nr:Rrf2 family transcriptional regulator [Hydrogenimonas thermophila]WOE70964.1 Rrf2 family transcriptional regulator [Hydrogenimonas thermophila]WOE73482.1 Rrf2 family transcriptional regulator [Hydrogenimonas thermophila]SFP11072.1 transcriptional regulator, BadM/Rrf2 family [Hydrogenimonas thermophila]